MGKMKVNVSVSNFCCFSVASYSCRVRNGKNKSERISLKLLLYTLVHDSNTAAPLNSSFRLFLVVVLFNLQNLPESSKVIAGSNKVSFLNNLINYHTNFCTGSITELTGGIYITYKPSKDSHR